MSDANRFIITGRLTRDAELRYTPNKTPVTNVTVACNRVYKSDDEYKEEATFVDVTIWATLAEKLTKKLKQGVHVLVEGRLRNESWEQDGEKRSRLTVVAERVNISPPNKRSDDSDVPFKV
jgi:single-strand DNA-binding protein